MLLRANLFLRLALVALAVGAGHWRGGDTGYYLDGAFSVCQGAWGGDDVRTPIYLWFLCGLSPTVSSSASAFHVALPLLVQTLLVWAGGLALWRATKNKWITAAWAYDPGLLVYSGLIMSDALEGVGVLFFALSLNRILARGPRVKPDIPALAVAGASLAVAMMARPIGLPLGWFTLAMLGVMVLRRKLNRRSLAVLLLVWAAFVGPRLYWMGARYGTVQMARQGHGWLESVAGVVENYGLGLDYYQSEHKWVRDHAGCSSTYVYRNLLEHLPTWAYLSAKGAARVFFGHVNVEWVYLLTGTSPLGPGWFKVPEHRPAPRVQSGLAMLVWILGVLSVAGFCTLVYRKTYLALRARRVLDTFTVWALGSIFILAAAPQVWGDARFRIPIWPLVLVLWGRSRNVKK